MVGRLDQYVVPSPADAYPAQLGGEPVLTPDQARSQAMTSASATPFLVGGWASYAVPELCPPDPGFPDTPLLQKCDDGYRLYGSAATSADDPGVPLAASDIVIPLARPIVLRVHSHDPGATGCPADYDAACSAAIVVDAVAW